MSGKPSDTTTTTTTAADAVVAHDDNNNTTVTTTTTTTAAAAAAVSPSSVAKQRLELYGSRALAAGSRRHAQHTSSSSPSSSSNSNNSAAAAAACDAVNASSSPSSSALTSFGARRGSALGTYIQAHQRHSTALQPSSSSSSLPVAAAAPSTSLHASPDKYLVVGDGLMAPFMALCLRTHGLDCDLAYHVSRNDADRGAIVLTPSVTQLMGDVLSVSVPSGSVVGRILSFDHVGNDMCDIDLNEFREQGESPTFFCCDRDKVQAALLSLCHVGVHSCHVLPQPSIDRGGLAALPHGAVRVRFASGVQADYRAVICTARNQQLVPELTLDNAELQQRNANAEVYKAAAARAVRWLEVCVPPLPPLAPHEKRFTPGSQEIVEILTPREAKMTVRPTMMATRLFYHVGLIIPDDASDPRLRTTSLPQFWDDVVQHWTSGIPGYVSHTLFRPMFTHVQQHMTRTSALVSRTPLFVLPHWTEGDGRVLKVAHAVHGACYDAIDVGDAQSFSDCFGLARALARGDDARQHLRERRLQVVEEMDYHTRLTEYGIKERGQTAYMLSRFNMKLLRKYKQSWRSILRNYVTLMPQQGVRALTR